MQPDQRLPTERRWARGQGHLPSSAVAQATSPPSPGTGREGAGLGSIRSLGGRAVCVLDVYTCLLGTRDFSLACSLATSFFWVTSLVRLSSSPLSISVPQSLLCSSLSASSLQDLHHISLEVRIHVAGTHIGPEFWSNMPKSHKDTRPSTKFPTQSFRANIKPDSLASAQGWPLLWPSPR